MVAASYHTRAAETFRKISGSPSLLSGLFLLRVHKISLSKDTDDRNRTGQSSFLADGERQRAVARPQRRQRDDPRWDVRFLPRPQWLREDHPIADHRWPDRKSVV